MDTQLVKLEILEPHVGIVTIDNPSVNAYSTQVLDEIALVFDVISDRDDIRVAILTGAGKVFCAGADIKERTRAESHNGDYWQRSRCAREAYHSIVECQKPVIAALNGVALGGGLALAASCDILLAAQALMPAALDRARLPARARSRSSLSSMPSTRLKG